MPFTLDSIVPWGRSLDEYVGMFELSRDDLEKQILGCADGPASFNAEMNSRGKRVVSIDPVFCFSSPEIRARIDETYPLMMAQLDQNRSDYRWERFTSPEALGEHRLAVMERFLADFPEGKEEGRYLDRGLESLPFKRHCFDLALCSHFLFLYSDRLTADFHRRAIAEMLRVAREVRIFPLLTLARNKSQHLEMICESLAAGGREFEIRTVDYEFQLGASRMLRIW